MLRQGEVFMIHLLKAQGLSISAIARRTGLDRKTIRRYLDSGVTAPSYGPRAPRPCKLDPYLDYLKERVEAYPGLSARRLLREIQAMGYAGGYSGVTDFLRDVRPSSELGFERRFETPAGLHGRKVHAHGLLHPRSTCRSSRHASFDRQDECDGDVDGAHSRNRSHETSACRTTRHESCRAARDDCAEDGGVD